MNIKFLTNLIFIPEYGAILEEVRRNLFQSLSAYSLWLKFWIFLLSKMKSKHWAKLQISLSMGPEQIAQQHQDVHLTCNFFHNNFKINFCIKVHELMCDAISFWQVASYILCHISEFCYSLENKYFSHFKVNHKLYLFNF